MISEPERGAQAFFGEWRARVQGIVPALLCCVKIVGKGFGYLLTLSFMGLLFLMLYSWYFIIVEYYYVAKPEETLKVFLLMLTGVFFGVQVSFNYIMASFGSPGFTTEHAVPK
jgi:hypothetical protein